MNGTITRVIGAKGFGFIRGEESKSEFFFHKDDCVDNFDEMAYAVETGQQVDVTFDSVPSPKGPRAANVTRIDNTVIRD